MYFDQFFPILGEHQHSNKDFDVEKHIIYTIVDIRNSICIKFVFRKVLLWAPTLNYLNKQNKIHRLTKSDDVSYVRNSPRL